MLKCHWGDYSNNCSPAFAFTSDRLCHCLSVPVSASNSCHCTRQMFKENAALRPFPLLCSVSNKSG